jgi:hypothetical protein
MGLVFAVLDAVGLMGVERGRVIALLPRSVFDHALDVEVAWRLNPRNLEFRGQLLPPLLALQSE